MMPFPKAASLDRMAQRQQRDDERLPIGTSVFVWVVLSTLSWTVFGFAALQFL